MRIWSYGEILVLYDMRNAPGENRTHAQALGVLRSIH